MNLLRARKVPEGSCVARAVSVDPERSELARGGEAPDLGFSHVCSTSVR
jgi:hypothetical protein